MLTYDHSNFTDKYSNLSDKVEQWFVTKLILIIINPRFVCVLRKDNIVDRISLLLIQL